MVYTAILNETSRGASFFFIMKSDKIRRIIYGMEHKTMKRTLSIVFVFSLLILMTACGSNAASGDDAPDVTLASHGEDNANDLGTSQAPDNTEPSSVPANAENTSGSVVYFTSDISPEGMMAVYEALGWTPTGSVAVKLSTGEPPTSNYLRPELIKELVQSVEGTIVECNTAYGGSRTETAMHMQVAKDHGFTEIADVDILDADGSVQLVVDGGSYLETNYVGTHFTNYDSYIVLSHFKGHAMAGFGGAIKNISIDCDCDGNPSEPDIHDIGILASTDPVAIDQAAIDLCFAAEGSGSLKQRVERQNGLHTLEHAEEIGLGSRTYELVNIDE